MAQKKAAAAKGAAIIEVEAEGKAWAAVLPRARALARRATEAALEGQRNVEVGILLSSDARVRRLNRTFRGKDKPTNVLSFPADAPVIKEAGPRLLGGIVLALQTCKREAREQGKSLANHMVHLVVHGVLHLRGHDHMKPREAAAMERIERRILAGFGIDDPYVLPDDSAAPRRKARPGRKQQ